jgi:hypothetical protein
MSTKADSRLDRILPGLTFDERLDALLAAYHEDRDADPRLLATMPLSDNYRWNHVADILDGLHTRLGWYIDLVESFITQLELGLALAEQARLVAGVFRHKGPEMDAAADALSLRVIGELVQRWQELRLAELAAEHFGEKLGGRRLLHPEAVATLSGCRERIFAMQERLANPDALTRYECELPEPSAADLDHLLELLTTERRLA